MKKPTGVRCQTHGFNIVYLTLKRRSLPTISPSFRHPLLLDLSNTSLSLLTSGSFNRLIFTDRSKESDMATSRGKFTIHALVGFSHTDSLDN